MDDNTHSAPQGQSAIADGTGSLAINAAAYSNVTVYQYVTRSGGKTETRETADPTICPYPGLEPFRTSEARFFAGRADDVDSLRTRIFEADICGIIAASGAGKSSLVYAGLIPALAEDETRVWDIFSFKPGQRPISELAKSLSGLLATGGSIDEQRREIASFTESLRTEPGALRDYLETIRKKRGETLISKRHEILIFVDQWEEFYTRENDQDRDILVRELMHVCDLGLAKVLLTMRIDFMEEMLVLSTDLFRAIKPSILFIEPMSEADLRLAIEEPAREAGIGVPKNLSDRLINELGGGRDHGSLPYLQFVLRQLWEMRDQATNRLTTEAYDSMKGLNGAIGAHADAVLRNLTKEEQGLAYRVLPRLANVSAAGTITSRRLPFADFDDPARKLLRKLAEAERRLVVLSSPTEEVAETEIIAEVAHEALLGDWKTLYGWISDRRTFFRLRNKLESDAKTWIENNRRNDFLIPSGKPLLDAQDLSAKAFEGDISKDLKDFVVASGRRARSRKWLTRGLLTAVVTGIAGVAVYLANVNQELSYAALVERRQRATALNNSGEYTQSARTYLEAVRYAQQIGSGTEVAEQLSREASAAERNLAGISLERIFEEGQRFISIGGATFLVLDDGNVEELVDWEAATVRANDDLSRFVLFSPQGRASYWSSGIRVSERDTDANGQFWASTLENSGFLIVGGYRAGPTGGSSGHVAEVMGLDSDTVRNLEIWRNIIAEACADDFEFSDLEAELVRDAYENLSAVYEFGELSDLCWIDSFHGFTQLADAGTSLDVVYDVHGISTPSVRETPHPGPWGEPRQLGTPFSRSFEPESFLGTDRQVVVDFLRWYWSNENAAVGERINSTSVAEMDAETLLENVGDTSLLRAYAGIFHLENSTFVHGVDNWGNAGKTNFACMGGDVATRCALFGGSTAENFYFNDMIAMFSENGDRLLVLTGSSTGPGFALFRYVTNSTNMDLVNVSPPTDRSTRNQILDGDILADGTRFVVASEERAFVYDVDDAGIEAELEARILAPPDSRILAVRFLNSSRVVLLIQQEPNLDQDFPNPFLLTEDQAEEHWNAFEDTQLQLQVIDIASSALVWESAIPLEDGVPFIPSPYSFTYPWAPALTVSQNSLYLAVRGNRMTHLVGAEYGLYYGAVASDNRFDGEWPIYGFRFSDGCYEDPGIALMIGDSCFPLFREQDASATLLDTEARLSRLLNFP